MSRWKLVYRVIRGSPSFYLSVCVFSLIMAIGQIGIPWLLKDIIDVAILREKHGNLNFIIMWMVVLITSTYLASVYCLRFEFQVVQEGVYDLRQYLYAQLIQQPLSFFSSKRMGELLHRVLQDTNTFEAHIHEIINELPFDVVIITSIFVLMFILSKTLFLAVVIFFCLCGIAGVLISGSLAPISKKVQTTGAELSVRLHETLAKKFTWLQKNN